MEPTKKKNRLPWYLLAAAVVYHANNLAHTSWQSKGKPLFVDASQHALAGIGYTARYFLGEENVFYFMGQKEPFQRLYVRNDPKVMEAGLEKTGLPYLTQVTALFREAKCRGITPIAAFIPPKGVVERERLPAVLPQPSLWESLGPKLAEDVGIGHRLLRSQDPRLYLDLFKSFESYHKQFPEEEIYVPWDYHLTSYGMAIVTAEIVKQLAARGEPISQPTLMRGVTRAPHYDDNLIHMMRLPEVVLGGLNRFSWTEPTYEVQTEGKLEGVKRIVVLGTSFSARLYDEKRAFPQMLEKTFHVPVVHALVNGTTVDGLIAHLLKKGESLRAGDVLIVEQPFDHVLRKAEAFPKAWSTDRALASSSEALNECLSFGH